MIAQLKASNRYKISILLVGMSLFCFVLSICRYFISDTKIFLFLNWNLFLAFIPWLFSSIFILNEKLRNRKFILIVVAILWLLFFPNSPYILTDLFHLRFRKNMPLWFDLSLILSFAWTGLVFGFHSLMDIEFMLSKYFKKAGVTTIIILFLFISSFGVYIGRYLRFNSWDVINSPISMMNNITDQISSPITYPGTWGMTLLMGILLNLMYWSVKLMRNHE